MFHVDFRILLLGIYMIVICSRSVTSVGEERANFYGRLLVIMWFLLGGVSSSSRCLG